MVDIVSENNIEARLVYVIDKFKSDSLTGDDKKFFMENYLAGKIKGVEAYPDKLVDILGDFNRDNVANSAINVSEGFKVAGRVKNKQNKLAADIVKNADDLLKFAGNKDLEQALNYLNHYGKPVEGSDDAKKIKDIENRLENKNAELSKNALSKTLNYFKIKRNNSAIENLNPEKRKNRLEQERVILDTKMATGKMPKFVYQFQAKLKDSEIANLPENKQKALIDKRDNTKNSIADLQSVVDSAKWYDVSKLYNNLKLSGLKRREDKLEKKIIGSMKINELDAYLAKSNSDLEAMPKSDVMTSAQLKDYNNKVARINSYNALAEGRKSTLDTKFSEKNGQILGSYDSKQTELLSNIDNNSKKIEDRDFILEAKTLEGRFAAKIIENSSGDIKKELETKIYEKMKHNFNDSSELNNYLNEFGVSLNNEQMEHLSNIKTNSFFDEFNEKIFNGIDMEEKPKADDIAPSVEPNLQPDGNINTLTLDAENESDFLIDGKQELNQENSQDGIFFEGEKSLDEDNIFELWKSKGATVDKNDDGSLKINYNGTEVQYDNGKAKFNFKDGKVDYDVVKATLENYNSGSNISINSKSDNLEFYAMSILAAKEQGIVVANMDKIYTPEVQALEKKFAEERGINLEEINEKYNGIISSNEEVVETGIEKVENEDLRPTEEKALDDIISAKGKDGESLYNKEELDLALDIAVEDEKNRLNPEAKNASSEVASEEKAKEEKSDQRPTEEKSLDEMLSAKDKDGKDLYSKEELDMALDMAIEDETNRLGSENANSDTNKPLNDVLSGDEKENPYKKDSIGMDLDLAVNDERNHFNPIKDDVVENPVANKKVDCDNKGDDKVIGRKISLKRGTLKDKPNKKVEKTELSREALDKHMGQQRA